MTEDNTTHSNPGSSHCSIDAQVEQELAAALEVFNKGAERTREEERVAKATRRADRARKQAAEELQRVRSDPGSGADEVAAAERKLRSKEDPAKVETDLAAYHTEVKEMLLKRLRYHYMGTRQEEWSEYEKRLNAGLREFNEKES